MQRNKKKTSDFIPPNFQPNSEPTGEMFDHAYDELLNPYPSTKTIQHTFFDELTGGFRPREFTILCGQTGVGKTTFIANMSAALLQQNIKHYVASVETGPTDFIKRVASVFATEDLNTGDAVPVETLRRLHNNYGHILAGDGMYLSLYEDRFSVEELMADIAWHVDKKGVKIAFVDNLNFFLEVSKSKDQYVEMDRVTHELVMFCKSVDVHLVMVMHPKKTEQARVENEFDIKGSSTAVQESHNILLLNRPHPDDVKDGIRSRFDRELKLAKMRRRGKHVGSKVIFSCENGVNYVEKKMVEPQ